MNMQSVCRHFMAILIMAACFVNVGCNKDKSPIPVMFITLSDTEIVIEEGETCVLECIVSPHNADNKMIIWSSNNKSVATVDNGVVTAVKAGEAVITAVSDDGGKTTKCDVVVIEKGGDTIGGDDECGINMEMALNLSSSGTANCYIVSKTGTYKFKAVKGNSNTSVGGVTNVEVLWETYGTSTPPKKGELVADVCHRDGYIGFQCYESFFEGNAVIAAKDIDDNILWSWHIWFTDEPQAQKYYDNMGSMMDRNLGATSATPGSIGAIGLMYQWGRKDPFLGGGAITSKWNDPIYAVSTITWPKRIGSDPYTGTIEYAIANPTTFITSNQHNKDWHYTGSSSVDNTRWQQHSKSIYDPCPTGWRVPSYIWSKEVATDLDYNNCGINYTGLFGSDENIWYPAAGGRNRTSGGLLYLGSSGYYWSASPSDYDECNANIFSITGGVDQSALGGRASGLSVRCIKE